MPRRRLGQLSRVFAAGLLVAWLAVLTAGAASGTDSSAPDNKAAPGTMDATPLTQDELRVAQAQEAVDPLVSGIDAAVRTGSLTGYSSTVVDLSTRTVHLYWEGPVPQVILDLPVPSSVTLVLGNAKFSRQQMTDATDRLFSALSASAEFAGSGLKLSSVDQRPDGSGIDVHASYSALSLGAEVPVIPDWLTATVVAVADPVSVVSIDGSTPVGSALGRMADNPTSPGWFGGARIYNWSANSLCTTGYTTALTGGSKRMTTAQHCTDGTFAQWVTPLGAQWAMASHVSLSPYSWQIDSALVQTSLIVGAPVQYTGVYNSTTWKYVGAQSATAIGDQICSSGASSGMHCGLTVQMYTSWPNDEDGEPVFGYWAWTDTIGLAVAKGDSGGTAFVQRSDGKVTVRGMIDEWGSQITCPVTTPPTINPDVVPVCGHHVGFVSTPDLNAYWGTTTSTG